MYPHFLLCAVGWSKNKANIVYFGLALSVPKLKPVSYFLFKAEMISYFNLKQRADTFDTKIIIFKWVFKGSVQSRNFIDIISRLSLPELFRSFCRSFLSSGRSSGKKEHLLYLILDLSIPHPTPPIPHLWPLIPQPSGCGIRGQRCGIRCFCMAFMFSH